MQCILYALATVWFYMACMVAVRVVRGLGAEDSRSDDEGEGSPLEDVPNIDSSSHHITPCAMTNGHGDEVMKDFQDEQTNGHGNGNGNGEVRKRNSL